ncbi:cell division protein FtsQ/DivIB [Allomuricauda sp. SCSIO 65647]|uniref:cell division protein FtsQ/DivIB n=1 Tax=Allomuricauda sp. SCSIO 65647 TaxID=2908843 RepID=UPI001F24352D|nr:cell division protein FtsQ/DivIB [Muricauda sp. SCSIO 65647]UJH68202.1 cell division protein FtsQ/DivIB [Muricauda sp. SCSIO 65647]
MRVNADHIKLSVLVLAIIGLYGFSNHRSNLKKVNEISIKFLGDNDLYLTEATVNKLLMKNYGSLKNRPKEEVALNTIEQLVESNAMVKNAQVYFTVNGDLITKIVQRRPIGRVEGASKFYLDDQGKHMPLSKNHSARVPIITGKITGKSLEDAYTILEYINKDEFLRMNVIGIHIEDEGSYQLKFRMENFVVDLGGIENLNEKFKNFMAFYAKATKDKTLEKYATVSLEFENQVVCTKI